jgi:hypothetical protein
MFILNKDNRAAAALLRSYAGVGGGEDDIFLLLSDMLLSVDNTS